MKTSEDGRRKSPVIHGIYVVIDLNLIRGDVCEITRDIVEGGANIIQLRGKEVSTKELLWAGTQITALCEGKVPFIINDRVDISLALSSDGVHLGQDDMPVSIARNILGSGKIIGLSVHSVEEARKVGEGSPDYLGVGSIYPTTTKTDVSPVGVELIRKIKKEVDMPVVAIGGIGEDNIGEVIEAGADAVAVCSAVLSSDDVRAATEKLVSKWGKK